MKVLYLLTFAAICLMFTAIFIFKGEKVEIAKEYHDKCKQYGGESYIVEDTENELTLLCFNTDLFLLMPGELKEVDKKEESK